jgi:hypothetical protein
LFGKEITDAMSLWPYPLFFPEMGTPRPRIPSFEKKFSRCRVAQRGYRVREVLLVATLLDAQLYPAIGLAIL